jgi:hypothetical protein
MKSHPIELLAPAFISALLAGLCLGVAAHAVHREAASIVLVGGIGALFFGYRSMAEAYQAWRPLVVGLQRRRDLRRTAALTRINNPKDDAR